MLRGERQGLGDPAAGGVQHGTQGAHRPGGPGRGGHERQPLVGGEVEALALGIVQLHRCDRCNQFRNTGRRKSPRSCC